MVNKGNIAPKNHTKNYHAKRKIRILHKNNMSQKFATLSKFKVFL